MRSRLKKLRAAERLLRLALIVMVGLFLARCAFADLRPAPRLAQAYQLGIDEYTPNAAIVRLDLTIKTSKLSTDALAQAAEDTRKTELDSYHDTVTLLKTMGAPEPVIQPFLDAVASLSQPLTITDNAKAQVPTDPAGQTVWSTLDEAEQIVPDSTGELSAWLKLSHGRDSLWAYHLGNMIAVVREKFPDKSRDIPLISGAGALSETVPAGTPDFLTDALDKLGDESKHNRVDSKSLQALDDAAAKVFEATATSSAINSTASSMPSP